MLLDRFRPRHKRRFHLPSLPSYLMNVTTLYSMSRQSRAQKFTDLHFKPPLERVGILEWEKLESIVRQGHAHGVEALDRLEPEALRRFLDASVARTGAASGSPGAHSPRATKAAA
jgi:NTE family protein